MSAEDAQRHVARLTLHEIRGAGFALAGSGAIREHGIIARPTEDIDLFTSDTDATVFDRAVDEVLQQLRKADYGVKVERRVPGFARVSVYTSGGFYLDLDLGIDWREHEPVNLQIGPVLSVEDAVGNKVSALYSRAEPRDYLDVDAIRSVGPFTDEELIEAAAERDAGFELNMFAAQLDAVRRITQRDVSPYGVTADELVAVKQRSIQWARHLRGE